MFSAIQKIAGLGGVGFRATPRATYHFVYIPCALTTLAQDPAKDWHKQLFLRHYFSQHLHSRAIACASCIVDQGIRQSAFAVKYMFSSKKKGSKKPPKATQTTLAGSPDDKEPTQINLLDSGAVKRELDEAVARAAKQAGFQEDHFVSNVKILLGLGACAIALVAQFFPGKYPDNWWLLLFCVIGYAICTAALNLFLSRFEKDSFLFTQQQKDSPPLKFVSKMPRHSTTYTLSVAVNEDKTKQQSLLHPLPWIHTLLSYIPGWQSGSELDSSHKEELSELVTQYFHSDGYLDEPRFAQDVQKILKAMQAMLSRKAQ